MIDVRPAPELRTHPDGAHGARRAPSGLRALDGRSATARSPRSALAASDAVTSSRSPCRRGASISTREADLVEEIGRHLGYDRIPAAIPHGAPLASDRPAARGVEEAVRDRMCAFGFHEAFNYAMIGPGEDDPFVPEDAPAPLTLANPIAETLGFLRRSVLPGLLRAADQNLRRGVGRRSPLRGRRRVHRPRGRPASSRALARRLRLERLRRPAALERLRPHGRCLGRRGLDRGRAGGRCGRSDLSDASRPTFRACIPASP